jgi:cell wall-associated NlpC family hydrolase
VGVRATGLAIAAVVAFVMVTTAVVVSVPNGAQPWGGMLRPGSVPAPYAALVARAGARCSAAPAALLAAQLEAESGWNPARSPAGAQGLAQFMPGTWARWGQDADGDGRRDPLDPVDAVASQAVYDCALAEQMWAAVRGGQVTGQVTDLMLAAYNAGPAAVLAAHGIPAIQETRGYVARITSRAASFLAIAGAGPASGFAARLVQVARGMSGTPYAWGGGDVNGPTEGFGRGRGVIGFDCSGLVLYAAYRASGGRITLPRSADQQTRVGRDVPLDALQPGDLIGFTQPGEQAAHHVGIYLGDGLMVHAPQTGTVVRIDSLASGYWKGQTWRAVRLQP